MKIAIVSGHFTPELGYQEVYLARSFSRLGHVVRVFTSTAVSPTARKVVRNAYPPGLSTDPRYGFEIQRLASTMSLGANVLSRGLRSAVLAYEPDVVVIIAVAKLFPAPLLCEAVSSRASLVIVFGDASEYADTGPGVKRVQAMGRQLLFRVVKARLYCRAVRYGDRLVLNHAETARILAAQLPAGLRDSFQCKSVQMTLGYDPDEFGYDKTERAATRSRLGISSAEVVLITATRVTHRKNLENLVTMVSNLRQSGVPIRYIIVGFLGDDYESKLKAFIAAQPDPHIFSCYPFLGHHEIRQLYCAADIGVWLKAAISIQESMGTGLSVILEEKPVVGHLIDEPFNGWYFRSGQLEEVVRKACEQIAPSNAEARDRHRQEVAALNGSRLSYDNIARRMIEGL